MFIIEALHPEGWQEQTRCNLEYWAYQEAQSRCCAGGRNHRIVDADSQQVVALVNTSSCRLAPAIKS